MLYSERSHLSPIKSLEKPSIGRLDNPFTIYSWYKTKISHKDLHSVEEFKRKSTSQTTIMTFLAWAFISNIPEDCLTLEDHSFFQS